MPDRIDVTLADLHALRSRVDHRQLQEGDWRLLGALVTKQIARAEGRQERMAAKIRAQSATDGSQVIDAESSVDDAATGGASESEAAPPGTDPKSPATDRPPNELPPKKAKGHGRNGASAFKNAEHFVSKLAAGVIGSTCERCERGKMQTHREKIYVRIIGQPIFSAEQHHAEQARCRRCGHLVRAAVPARVHDGIGTDYVRYDWSACAMLLVMHYFAGAPFKRMESLHAGWGIPMPDANQWTMATLSDDFLLALFKALERRAVLTATNFRIDDTGAMVIEIRRRIEAEVAELRRFGESTKDLRTGINATASYWETPDGPIVLFYTGRHHAGEIVDQLLRQRPTSSPKLIKCTDGASKNFDHVHADKVIESTCNAHALLKFREIAEQCPVEYREVGAIYKQVFDNDDKAKDLGLNPVDRMLYHREHSKPLMMRLKKMCDERLTSKRVEPNSSLWGPLTFVVNQWGRLIQFCEVPGVPLDTNLVEQALIMPVRYFSGSFNYHTEDGAVVGDRVMSLIATARAHGVEPVAYLSECLRCHEDLAQRPEYYLPWVYRERMKENDGPAGPEQHRAVKPPPVLSG